MSETELDLANTAVIKLMKAKLKENSLLLILMRLRLKNLKVFDHKIKITTKVVNLVERISSIHFTDYQYFVLVDHIDFALKRALDGIDIPDGTVRWGSQISFQK